jgi:hypothetical protein
VGWVGLTPRMILGWSWTLQHIAEFLKECFY